MSDGHSAPCTAENFPMSGVERSKYRIRNGTRVQTKVSNKATILLSPISNV